MKHLSLRIRLTIVTIALVAALAVILTFSSVYNAGNIYGEAVTGDNAYPVTDVEAAATEDGAEIEFRNVSLLLMLGIIIMGGAAAYFVVGVTLRPVQELNRQIQGIRANNLGARLEINRTGDEISQLADSFNEMLEHLDEAFRTQQRFAAAAAHELKTPLAAIKTNLDVLNVEKTAGIEEFEETFAVIDKQTNRMIKLVDGLLASSASNSYALDITVELEEMIQDILTEQKMAIQEKHLLIEFKYTENIKIEANAIMLYRAIANLIENAVKYNFDGGKLTILISCQSYMADLYISNTGPNITPEHLSHIFEPFYRIDNSRSRKIAGAGLGLAIAKDTIQRHGGKLTMESKQGITTCHVKLPIFIQK